MNVAVRSAAERDALAQARAALRRLLADADARGIAVLGGAFVLLAALSWRAWGVPAADVGHELTTAALIAEGGQPYADLRYFYGPAGVYALGGAFALFGTTFTTAFAFGLVQAAAIGAAFYALARRLLTVLPATVATLVVLAIGFSGTAFNFVLPHTNSGTFGLLALLLMLLALSGERLLLAGVAAGVVCLTRPEFAAVAALAVAAYAFGVAIQRGARPALRALARLALPALAVAGVVLGLLAAQVGAHRLFLENIWPVEFLRVAGFSSQQGWAPLDLESAVATLARAGVYCTLLGAVLASAVLFARESRPAARLRALWPLPAALGLLLFADLLWRLLGAFAPAREAIEEECAHLVIGMTWLPALGFAAVALVAVRLVRRQGPPITSSWGFDLALIATAAALGARAYDAFSTEASYAPYYAPPLVLLLAVLHDRLSRRWPEARTALTAALAAVAVGLAAYAQLALYPDYGAAVRTPRGSFQTSPVAAPALQGALEYVDARTQPGEPVLALPLDSGFNFASERPPALYDAMFLPGLLYGRADEQAAIARLEAEGVRYAVVDRRRFSGYPFQLFGEDYDVLLGGWIRRNGPPVASFGDGRRVEGTYPPTAYDVYRVGP